MMHPENQSSKDPSEVASRSRLEETQQQVNEVVDIMKTNVERIIEREDKLNELDMRANNLTVSASEFQTTSRKLKRKYWWKNLKMMLILGCVVVLVIVVIVVATVGIPSRESGGDTTPPTTPSPNVSHAIKTRAIMGE